MEIIEKIKKVITDPVNFFKNISSETFLNSFKYLAILFAIFLILSAISSYIVDMIIDYSFSYFGIDPVTSSVIGVWYFIILFFFYIFYYIFYLLFFFAGVGFMHVYLMIFGARDYVKTFHLMVYSLTPTFVFGWIPLVGLFVGIWGLVLQIIGLREIHGFSTKKAILVYLLMIFIIFLIVLFIFLVILLLVFILGLS